METLTLPATEGETHQVVVEAVDLFAPEAELTSLPADAEDAEGRESVGIALEGRVNGEPSSRADLLLTSYGVYGVLSLEDRTVSYSPVQEAQDSWLQEVEVEPKGGGSVSELLSGAQERLEPADPSILGARVATPAPIEEGEPFETTVAIGNDAEGSTMAVLHAVASIQGEEEEDVWTLPFRVGAGYVTLVNVTMARSPGQYNISHELHTIRGDQTFEPLDTETMDVEVSRDLGDASETYVVSQGPSGDLPAGSTTVEGTEDQVRIEVGNEVESVLVHRAWLVDRFGSITADVPWSTTRHQSETWVEVPTGDDVDAVAFEAFSLGQEPVFTTGEAETVQLADRPMWVSLHDLETSQAPNGTSQAILSIDFEDASGAGQDLVVSHAWLRAHGIQEAVYHYPDGEQIPVHRTASHDVVEAPHFSIVVIEDFECTNCVGDPPDPNVWTRETTCCGVWEISGFDFTREESVKAQGGNFDDHMFAHRAISTVSPPEFSFWAHIGADDGQSDWHKFQWRLNGNRAIQVDIRTDGSGGLEATVPTVTGWFDTPFNATEWIPVRIFHIQWAPSPCTYSVQIGHKVIFEDVDFPKCKSSVNEVRIGSKGWGAEPWWVDTISYETGNLIQSNVKFDVSADVVAEYVDWEQFVTSAFQRYEHMWVDAPMYINLEISHLLDHEVNIITNDCDDATTPVDQYTDWLDASSTRTPSNVDAYQWWTGADMEKGSNLFPPECYGQANPDSVGGGQLRC